MASTPALIAYQKAHIHDDKRIEIAISNGIFLGVAVVAVILKDVARRLSQRGNRWDDWWIWASLFTFTLYIIGYQILVHYGMGRHSILITNLRAFVVTSIHTAILYNLTMFGIKMSLLCFYRRTFPGQWFKYALLGTGATVAGSSIAQLPCDILQCVPIRSQWDPNVPGKCNNFGAIILGFGILNIITDVMTLILPVPIIWRLKLSAARKRLVISTFMLGGFACVVSIVRAFYVTQFKGPDPSWGDINTSILCTVELGIGILSACLPAYRPIYNHLFHGKATSNTTSRRSKPYKQTSITHGAATRMARLNRDWTSSDRDILRSDDGHASYTRFGTTTNAQGEETIGHQHNDGNNDIWVTREFSVGAGADLDLK